MQTCARKIDYIHTFIKLKFVSKVRKSEICDKPLKISSGMTQTLGIRSGLVLEFRISGAGKLCCFKNWWSGFAKKRLVILYSVNTPTVDRIEIYLTIMDMADQYF